MSKRSFIAASLAVLAAFAPYCAAANIVAPGSDYTVYLKGETSLNAVNHTVVFDGLSESFVRAGLTLTVTESQADLGGGVYRISVNTSANGDLFPSAGEGAIQAIGPFGNGFDLLQPAYLNDARIKLYTADGLWFTTSNLADDYRSDFFSGLWDGTFVDGATFIIGNAGGAGINGVGFEFTLTAVPEPEISMMLAAGFGLLGFIARRRRRLR